MDTPQKWLTLDLAPPLPRRLKAVTALQGISMRQYCQAAIEKELTELLDGLVSTGIELREPARVQVKGMELAVELKQDSVYDAHYLALEGAFNSKLRTLDKRFYRAANSGHTKIRWIDSFTDE